MHTKIRTTARGLMIVGLLTLISCAGERPTTLGVQNNQLATCPDSPNCVSSFEQRESHAIAPLTGNIAAVRAALGQMPQAVIVTDDGNYIHAEFTSRLMGFVDDVEFLADPASGQIHVRSASRLGHSDLGVNRERVESIRELMAAD
ncbi:DUF1499 domain-containing protein [Pseudohongiella sp.]|uniref:DUF1499 domain-containing protein n=1 Tax=marine sediment metagenome TaxID=412755 RepID=A0A0F9YVA5_9ZZZZ|nr:DUF1499 domain-containing protein [Pseudohongiella sp.]